MGSPRFRRHLIRFRRFIDGSLAFAFPHRACWDLVPTFLQRSPPSLLTTAACSGLEPAPDRRLRGALPHLSYSCASPCGPAMLVTHSQLRKSMALGLHAGLNVRFGMRSQSRGIWRGRASNLCHLAKATHYACHSGRLIWMRPPLTRCLADCARLALSLTNSRVAAFAW